MKTDPEVSLVLFASTLGYCLVFSEELSILCADEKLVFKILLLPLYVYDAHASAHVCHSPHVLAKGKLSGVSSPLPFLHGVWGMNSDPQAGEARVSMLSHPTDSASLLIK